MSADMDVDADMERRDNVEKDMGQMDFWEVCTQGPPHLLTDCLRKLGYRCGPPLSRNEKWDISNASHANIVVDLVGTQEPWLMGATLDVKYWNCQLPDSDRPGVLHLRTGGRQTVTTLGDIHNLQRHHLREYIWYRRRGMGSTSPWTRKPWP